MDDVNKRIILYLMRDYRYSQRKIAKELNISLLRSTIGWRG